MSCFLLQGRGVFANAVFSTLKGLIQRRQHGCGQRVICLSRVVLATWGLAGLQAQPLPYSFAATFEDLHAWIAMGQ